MIICRFFIFNPFFYRKTWILLAQPHLLLEWWILVEYKTQNIVLFKGSVGEAVGGRGECDNPEEQEDKTENCQDVWGCDIDICHLLAPLSCLLHLLVLLPWDNEGTSTEIRIGFCVLNILSLETLSAINSRWLTLLKLFWTQL